MSKKLRISSPCPKCAENTPLRYAAQHPGATNELARAVGTTLLSDMKIESISVHGNQATVTLTAKSGAVIGDQYMKKIDGKWYLASLPGDQD